ncbi:hypothetical protein HHK36_028519 [Tetracentron sinense]|uniref:Uncharacterized protein n=1 Tax=Tetracentron sinense TaxID=13715 RepID=A0A835D0N5_TETSI|nr:hypothetical protein HHK36_028519 [Tetracentron sinense]
MSFTWVLLLHILILRVANGRALNVGAFHPTNPEKPRLPIAVAAIIGAAIIVLLVIFCWITRKKLINRNPMMQPTSAHIEPAEAAISEIVSVPHISSSGRQHNPNFNTSSFQLGARRTQCQLCGRWGHPVHTCRRGFDQHFHTDTTNAPAAFLASPSPSNDVTWYPDSSATNHITADLGDLNLHSKYADLGDLNLHSKYQVSDSLKVGHGEGPPYSGSPPAEFPKTEVAHVFVIDNPLCVYHRLCKIGVKPVQCGHVQ